MKIALPKGHLQKGVLSFLKGAGIEFTFKNDRDYRPACSNGAFAGTLVKVKAIPQLVQLGLYQVGFCGLDLVRENDYDLVEPILDLGLNRVRLVIALPQGMEDILVNPPKRPLLIATEYTHLASRWALARNLAHIPIQTYGSTEAYPPHDADIILDNTETGRTIEANGLVIVETLFDSTTHLVANKVALSAKDTAPQIEALKAALRESMGKAA
jgi:ATP phosphoribosyltransferase